MVRYESFHGTASNIAKNTIKYDKKNIKFTNFAGEISKGMSYNRNKRGTKPKPPGSLGYGFYTFIHTKELAEKFISKSYDDYTLIKVISCFEENEILDFNEKDVRERFHAFRAEFLKYVQKIYDQLGNPSNTSKQHAVDGIVIESFIQKLEKNEKKKIFSVLMWTFTPCEELEDEKFVSYVPNGLELCIRRKENITSLEEVLLDVYKN
ncbi:hypothetical protein [Enterococcus thailandicus]|uniref:hypothetical protein n=1 Tax=Enterococcus thailandicus TaxID=417368 RepID=UPI00288CAF93|nr:hypothetical protein [Enterococcus thailandicus]MDT2751908.1 hypothetical protein [Enterococcus thailandicus]MDT2776049.1 hypothetical protein [Enterococcus thailandicus]